MNKRLDGLLEMRMAKELNELEYATKKGILESERKQYEELISKLSESQNKADEQTARTLTFAERALREYTKGDLKKKREIVATFGSNLILKDKRLHIQAEEPFQVLTLATKEIPDLQPMFEPAFEGASKRENRALGAVNPTWLGSWDSNPGPIGYTLS